MACISRIGSYNPLYLVRDGGVSRYIIHNWTPKSHHLFAIMLENQMNEQMIYEIVENMAFKTNYEEMYSELIEIEPTYQQMNNDKDRDETIFHDLKMHRRRIIKEMRRKRAKIHKDTGLLFGGKDPSGGYVWGYKKIDS
jgi:hypothetical protein